MGPVSRVKHAGVPGVVLHRLVVRVTARGGGGVMRKLAVYTRVTLARTRRGWSECDSESLGNSKTILC